MHSVSLSLSLSVSPFLPLLPVTRSPVAPSPQVGLLDDQDYVDLQILLLLSPKCWEHRHIPQVVSGYLTQYFVRVRQVWWFE